MNRIFFAMLFYMNKYDTEAMDTLSCPRPNILCYKVTKKSFNSVPFLELRLIMAAELSYF